MSATLLESERETGMDCSFAFPRRSCKPPLRFRPGFRWKVDQVIASRKGSIHDRRDAIQLRLDQTPPVLAEGNNSDFSIGEILLISKIFIGRQQKIETRLLGDTKQITVEKHAPTLLVSGFNNVAGKELAKREWRCLIEQDQHQRASRGASKL